MSQKIDVTDECHEMIRAYCKSRDLRVKGWASSVLLATINADAPPPQIATPKKLLAQLPTGLSDAWSKRPFWKDPKYRAPRPLHKAGSAK